MTTRKDNRIRSEAYDWIVELADGNTTQEKRVAFEHWYAVKAHAEVFDQVQARLDIAGALDTDVLEKLRQPLTAWERMRHGIGHWHGPLARWPLAVAAVAAVFLAAVVMGLLVFQAPRAHIHETDIAEIRDIVLKDGSKVTLGGGSRISVIYSRRDRQVMLLAGEAFFDVTEDSTRPFIVQADGTRVRVVGTRFGVRRGPSGLRVAVEQGVVEVSREVSPAREIAPIKSDGPEETEEPQKAILTAGEKIVSGDADPLSQEQIEKVSSPPSAWREGRLIYSDASFSDIIADINRYYAGQLVIISDDLRVMRFTSILRIDELDQFIEGLPSYLPVELIRQGKNRILIRSLSRKSDTNTGPKSD